MEPEVICNFIRNLYSTGKQYRHAIIKPNISDSFRQAIIESMSARWVEIQCDCTCSGRDHVHSILETDVLTDRQWSTRLQNCKRKATREGWEWPIETCFKKYKNSSQLMNNVMYILGTTSVNYKNGFAKYVNGAHVNHIHPFERLPPQHVLGEAREILRAEVPQLQREYEQWKREMEERRRNKINYFRGNRG